MFRIVKDDMPPLPQGLSEELNDFLQTCFRKDPASRPAATELFDHIWLKKYCPDLVSIFSFFSDNWLTVQPSLRAQDSIPFLRRVSTNFGRPSLDLGENDRGFQSRRQSYAESAASRPRMSIEEQQVLNKSGRSSQESSKMHNLIATTFAKRKSPSFHPEHPELG
jgi:serine/threonine protein kinase